MKKTIALFAAVLMLLCAVPFAAIGEMNLAAAKTAGDFPDAVFDPLGDAASVEYSHNTNFTGESGTVTGQFLTPYLDEFHHQHPGIRLKIVSGRSAKVLSMLKSGAVDIAFASSPTDPAALHTWSCFATHSVFVAGSGYDCDFDHVYTRQEIAEFPLILLERKASSRVFLEQYFLQSGITLTPEIELSSRSLLVSLARIGLGVAGVTLEFVQKALDSGDIRLLKTDFTIPARSVDMCTLRDVTPTAAASAFMEMVRQDAR